MLPPTHEANARIVQNTGPAVLDSRESEGGCAFRLIMVPKGPAAKDGLRAFLRNALRSWDLRTIKVEQIVVDRHHARRSDPNEQGDEVLPEPQAPAVPPRKFACVRGESGLSPTKESRLVAMVEKAKAKEAAAARKAK